MTIYVKINDHQKTSPNSKINYGHILIVQATDVTEMLCDKKGASCPTHSSMKMQCRYCHSHLNSDNIGTLKVGSRISEDQYIDLNVDCHNPGCISVLLHHNHRLP